MPIGSPLQTLRPNQTLDCTLSLHSRESVLIYLFKQQLSLSQFPPLICCIHLRKPKRRFCHFYNPLRARQSFPPDYTRSTPFDRRQGLEIANLSVQLLLWTPATYICLCDATLLPLGHICGHSPYEDALLQSCDFAVVGSIRGSRFANLGRDLDARDWSYSQELLFETLSSPSPWMTRTALRLLCAEMVDVESLRLRCAWCAANGRMSMSCAPRTSAIYQGC